MSYYSVPTGRQHEEVGLSFNKHIVTDLLRKELGVDGIVRNDWEILSATRWGVEHLPIEDSMVKAVWADIDQFGGEADPGMLVHLVRARRITTERVDQSTRRLFREKFVLGLFDNPFVYEEQAVHSVKTAQAQTEGLAAHLVAQTLLVNGDGAARLPLQKALSVYIEGMDPTTLAGRANVVATPDNADVTILRLVALFEQRGYSGIWNRSSTPALSTCLRRISRILRPSAQIPTGLLLQLLSGVLNL